MSAGFPQANLRRPGAELEHSFMQSSKVNLGREFLHKWVVLVCLLFRQPCNCQDQRWVQGEEEEEAMPSTVGPSTLELQNPPGRCCQRAPPHPVDLRPPALGPVFTGQQMDHATTWEKPGMARLTLHSIGFSFLTMQMASLLQGFVSLEY